MEAHLSSVRKQRIGNTLEWARNMHEFQTWRTCIEPGAKERILWIRGTLGVGKTIMSGYFIELLKCLNPDAIVAYFFCRSGEVGLTKARDIIRTVAYQCIKDDFEARSVLESLQCKDFQIDDNIAVGFLFDKLLREPLTRTSNEVYIIVDGLDEADRSALDDTVHPPRPEIDILLEHFGTLKSARLLFVSRGEADVSRIIPHSITRPLDKNDNMQDIKTYVQQTIDGSERLNQHFKIQGIDPIKYFHDNANGIFLWVVVALHQLERTRSASQFGKYLDEFSRASGGMDRLYTSVLMSIEEEDRKWIQEILKWLVVAQTEFSIAELREAVEWSLEEDQFPDFERFLEVECGSMLHLLWQQHDKIAQLIHETFRSFLTDQDRCPPPFYIDKEATSYHVVNVCLRVLSHEPWLDPVKKYAINWYMYLLQAENSEKRPPGFLASLYRFFHSRGGCKRWISYCEASYYQGPTSEWVLCGREEDNYMFVVCRYLKRCQGFVEDGANSVYQSLTTPEDKADMIARKWRLEILQTPTKLAEYLGKAAAELWLYEDLPWMYIPTAVAVSIKYYCCSQGRQLHGIADFKKLAANNFDCISTWIGNRGSVMAVNKNLGVAFFTVGLWTEAITCLQSEIKAEGIMEDETIGLWKCIGQAYFKKGDYDGAIEAFKKAIEINSRNAEVWDHLALAYYNKRDFGGAIKSFGKSMGNHPSFISYRDITLSQLLYLGDAYAAIGNHRGEIASFKRATNIDPSCWFIWQSLAEAYISAGNKKGLINCYRAAVKKNPGEEWAIAGLRLAQNAEFSGTQPHRAVEDNNRFPSLTGNTIGTNSPACAGVQDTPREAISSEQLKGNPQPLTHRRQCNYWYAVFNKNVSLHFDLYLVQTLEHIGCVYCIQFSPDGKYVVTGCDNIAQVFEVSSGTRVASFSQLEDDTETVNVEVRALGFSPDGRYLAIAGEPGTVRISDLQTKESILLKLGMPTERDYCFAFSQDGKFLASGTEDGVVTLWRLNIGNDPLSVSIDKHVELQAEGSVIVVAFSPDNKSIAAKGSTSHIFMWDTETGNLVKRLHRSTPTAVSYHPTIAFCPTGNKLMTDGKDAIELWEDPFTNGNDGLVERDTERASQCLITQKEVGSLAWSPDGRWIIWGETREFLHFWDMARMDQFVLKRHDTRGICALILTFS